MSSRYSNGMAGRSAAPRGSHFTFTREGAYPFTVPVHNDKVRRPYLDRLCQRLGLDEQVEETSDDEDT